MSAAFALPAPFVDLLDTLLAPPTAPRVVATDPRYQLLRQELARLESLTGDAPDWHRVADLGAGLLRDTAKELLIAAYAALAQVKLHGLHGVHFSLLVLTRLLAAPDLMPPRPISRARALEWYLTRLRPELLALPLAPELAPAVRALPDALRLLRTSAQALLGDDTPNFGPLLQIAESLCLDLTEPEPASPPPPATSAPVPSVTSIESDPPAIFTPVDLAPAGTTGDEDPLRPLRDAATSWLAPIDPTNACGPDPVSHETFIEIRAEIQKLGALTDTVVDWSLIETRSSELLQRHAKDLRLAAYFTLARHRSAGLRGLTLGLVVTAALLETYKEALHPRQARARRLISDWFIGQIATVIGATPEPLAAADLAALRAACEGLAGILSKYLGNDAPSQRPLRDALQRLEVPIKDEPATPASTIPPASITAPIPSTAPTAPPPASPEVTTVQAAVNVTAVTDLSQIDKFLDATDDALVQTAHTLREAQPSDPRAYRLLRLGIWLRMTSPPPVCPDGNTAIPGLADRDRATLDDMLARQRWSDLVHRSENLLRRHRLILDLQRFTALALAGLDQAPAVLALRAELCALLLRFPTLPTLRDNAGRPLADPDTQGWLSEHILPRGRTPPPAATEDPEPAYWSDLSTRLRDATRDATLAEAQARIDSSPSRHLRFTRGVTLAEALLLAGDLPLAAHLFTGLSAEAERDGLDLWDPALVIRCLTGAARSHHRRGHFAPRDQALQHLSRLDAATTAALLTELP